MIEPGVVAAARMVAARAFSALGGAAPAMVRVREGSVRGGGPVAVSFCPGGRGPSVEVEVSPAFDVSTPGGLLGFVDAAARDVLLGWARRLPEGDA